MVFPLAACNIDIASPDGDGRSDGRGRTRLPAPTGLTSISLDRAVHLSWSSSVVTRYPEDFRFFRVYSARWDDDDRRCEGEWVIEGTTVSDAFVVGSLQNGVTRCFGVSTVAEDDGEGPRSAARTDTPRFGGSFVVIDAFEARAASSGFVFQEMSSSRVGVVTDGSRPDLDFRIERRLDGSLWLRPIRSGTRVMPFGTAPVPDLSRVDRAPSSGYAFVQVEAVSGFAYVFSVPQPDGVHYGAVRIAYVARDYVVLDWSYQSRAGSAELFRL